MISPLDLVKRVGVGGRLVPFFKCVCVYFAVAGGGDGGAGAGGGPSALSVCVKCAPVLCLLLVVALHAAELSHNKCSYSRLVCCGLALSLLGDALLLWPHRLSAGMASFGAAQIAYAAAFGWRVTGVRTALVTYATAALAVSVLSPPVGLRVPLALYVALLATMTWRGTVRGGCARAGALLFAASDAALGHSMFGAGPILPYHHTFVMITYYLGQLSIALSALSDDVAAHAHR